MEARTVKKGKHGYKPGHGLGFRAKTGGFTLRFILSSEAWYNTANDGPLETDGRDINKIGGISYVNILNPFTWPKNKDAAAIGWRPASIPDMFEVFAYVNDSKGGHRYHLLGVVEANVEYTAYCGRWDGKKAVRFSIQGVHAVMPVRRRNFQVNIGPWFGGNKPSPNDHHIYTDLKLNSWD